MKSTMSDEEKALRKERMANYDRAMNKFGHYSMDGMERRRKHLPKSPILEEIRLREEAERGGREPVSNSVSTEPVSTPEVSTGTDRAVYMRDLMRKKRAEEKARRVAASEPQP